MAKKKKAVEEVVIKAPNMQRAQFVIEGTAPLVICAFSQKAREAMKATQEAGHTAKKGKRREAKDFQQCYEEAKHISQNGWCGFNAAGLRAGLISACRMAGFTMTRAKLSIFIVADGYDSLDMVPLVKITQGEPHYVEHTVRLESGVCDLRARPMWDPGWRAEPVVEWDADQFTLQDVSNLLCRVGIQVGIGEGRPDSKKSCGMDWGKFRILNDEETKHGSKKKRTR